MKIAKKITSLLGEIISHPTRTSYLFNKDGNDVVIRSGGDNSGDDLSGLSLKGLNLREINFEGANLSGVDFSGAHLEGANFLNATLVGAKLAGAHLEGVRFDIDNLSSAIIESPPNGISDEVIMKIRSGG